MPKPDRMRATFGYAYRYKRYEVRYRNLVKHQRRHPGRWDGLNRAVITFHFAVSESWRDVRRVVLTGFATARASRGNQ